MFAAALASAIATTGCFQAPRASAPSADAAASTPASSPQAPPRTAGSSERHVYRFDFVLSSDEGGAAPTSASFTLNLQELEKGEVVFGKNVALSTAGATASGPAPIARQDVGIKVSVICRAVGDEVVLEVSAEVSSFEPPSTVRKVVSRGSALATPGKPSLVATLDEDHQRHRLTVTATKLR